MGQTGHYVIKNKKRKVVRLNCGCVIEYRKDLFKGRVFRSICYKHKDK